MATDADEAVIYLREKIGLALMELRNVPSVLLDGRGRVNLVEATYRLEEALEGTTAWMADG